MFEPETGSFNIYPNRTYPLFTIKYENPMKVPETLLPEMAVS